MRCGVCERDAAAIAKALTPTDIPIGMIVEATWEDMRRPPHLRSRVENFVGYLLATIRRKAERTPLESYRDRLEQTDPTGEIYLASLDEAKRARITVYMKKAGIPMLPGPRLRDVANYLDYRDRMMDQFSLTS
jgi:hypothetical protein